VIRIFCLSLILVLILGLLPNYSTKLVKEDLILKNGCLIYSIQYQHALTAKNILNESDVWAKIILYKLQGEKTGHAVTLYIYKNSTYVYDPAFASYRLSQFPIYNPYKIVQLMHPMSKILWVEYAEAVMIYNL
jgi:CDP-glycerol glycerophosphotransferase (TagB/SpsB family)